jgi:hypothetical protein
MIDSQIDGNALDDIEALVRAAGGYVQASSDLRPRVLEQARQQRDDRRWQSRCRRLAAVIMLWSAVSARQFRADDTEQSLELSARLPAKQAAQAFNHQHFSNAEIGFASVEAFLNARDWRSPMSRSSL